MTPNSIGCPLCGGLEVENTEAFAHDSNIQHISVAIRACKKCDFAWQWPLGRTTEQSRDYFESEYQTERKASYFDKGCRIEIARLQLDFLAELNTQPLSLLDIGCGDGTFAKEAAIKGWQVTGIDPAIPLGAKPYKDINIIGGTTDDLNPNDKFMCVTLWDVIEHIPDPELLLKKAWERLQPNGWLVLETGNYQSVERILAQRNWWAWQLDHRWYFSPPTLLHLLEPFKLADVRMAERVFRPWSQGSSDYSPPSRFQTLLSVLKRPLHKEAIIIEHSAKREAFSKWPKWAGLEIFTIAVKK